MKNRKAAEKIILDGLSDLDTSGKNTEMTKQFFAGMSDAEFDQYMRNIEEEKDFVSLVYENMSHSPITTDNNYKVAKKWGYELFERLWLTDPNTGALYMTPLKYPVIYLPMRRQVQLLDIKISVAEDNKHLDEMTDQPTGISKGGGLSFPETLILYSHGLTRSLEELLKVRGGDLKAYNLMNRQIQETGEANLDYIGN